MSAVNFSIVREYFESLGYMVSQPHKYGAAGRAKTAEEELDLLVAHPLIEEQKIPAHVLWTGADLRGVRHAVVGIRGWHTERFYAARFDATPEILRFASPETVRFAAVRLGTSAIAKILCVPQLPDSGELKEKTLKTLREKGIDGVLPFRTILLEILAGIDKNRNYDKSDLLQILRILKAYDLILSGQMDLFGVRRKKQKTQSTGAA